MFRLWAREIKNNKTVRDLTVTDDRQETRTHKINAALEAIGREFDLAVPIWLNKNISEFKRLSKTRFDQDNFIEAIDFDYLEIQMLEEDF
ncbi:MAG: hypothetical protein IJT16_12370 [Lachnospiraceae bacterium]|nr:hypothetical protein [Lachnospiraceae bacterium]